VRNRDTKGGTPYVLKDPALEYLPCAVAIGIGGRYSDGWLNPARGDLGAANCRSMRWRRSPARDPGRIDFSFGAPDRSLEVDDLASRSRCRWTPHRRAQLRLPTPDAV